MPNNVLSVGVMTRRRKSDIPTEKLTVNDGISKFRRNFRARDLKKFRNVFWEFWRDFGFICTVKKERVWARKRERGSKEEREWWGVCGGRWSERFAVVADNLMISYLFWVNLLFEIEIFKLFRFFMVVNLSWIGLMVSPPPPPLRHL